MSNLAGISAIAGMYILILGGTGPSGKPVGQRCQQGRRVGSEGTGSTLRSAIVPQSLLASFLRRRPPLSLLRQI